MHEESLLSIFFSIRSGKIRKHKNGNFSELLKVCELDPLVDLKFGDWSEVNFRDCDLRGWDFTGSSLRYASFIDAIVDATTKFDHADLEGAVFRKKDIDRDRVTRFKDISSLEERSAEDIMLDHLVDEKIKSTLFEINGKKKKGKLVSYGDHCVLIELESGNLILVYRHSLSVITPGIAIRLDEE